MAGPGDVEIKAVHVADLGGILEERGQLRNFEAGRMRCYVCQDVLSVENAGSIRLRDGKFALTCSKTQCYSRILPDII